ncbi:polysaccharide biosynthesis protein [Noviherbaspirillum sp. 17J57-3]|uniref:Polysaccharide biosynthesis protein n=2 Tax=Noviherbaspirillum galbum TaxID=2709383 RepID=A0A6B3SSU8_9BURK|nr:polysaccharide biosynthesis protein [Noviherbaspirillum galbum]
MRRSTKIAVTIAIDLVSLPLCLAVAMILRLGSVEATLRYGIYPYLVIAVITVPAFLSTGLYSAVIRYIDYRLLLATGAGLAAVIASTYALLVLFDFTELPLSALVIYWFIAFSYVVASRLSARVVLRIGSGGAHGLPSCAVGIYGAGEAGSKLALAMRGSDKYRALCFFDDHPGLDQRNVAGLKVFHSSRIADVTGMLHLSMIIIAIPSATVSERRQVMHTANTAGVKVKILCNLLELADEQISTRSIRELKIDDLLGREPIRPHQELFSRCVRAQRVLVTGGGGSIGSELCRQIMTQSPAELHVLDHCEFALYNIHQELLAAAGGIPVRAHLGSACDAGLVERIMRDFSIDTVYHAAAYKHVPLVEDNIAEGIRNNIVSAEVVANTAGKYKVKTCVLISTDKAVRPTSIMGASKRIAELIFQAANMTHGGSTRYCMVRFGNVLGSSGSVVPLFKSQIERGGPITITHPEVVRYFMSIPEAAQLVMQAGAMATGGDVFVMDMGDQVKICDLARTMIAMCGLKEKNASNPEGDIEIRFVGLRPGEKLYEELFAGKDAIPSRHPRIMTTSEYVVEPPLLAQQLAYLHVACANNDMTMIRFLVKRLVEEYQPAARAEPENVVPLPRLGPERRRKLANA